MRNEQKEEDCAKCSNGYPEKQEQTHTKKSTLHERKKTNCETKYVRIVDEIQ